MKPLSLEILSITCLIIGIITASAAYMLWINNEPKHQNTILPLFLFGITLVIIAITIELSPTVRSAPPHPPDTKTRSF